MLDDTLLEDPARLAEADGAGWLRQTALAGAQVRATAGLVAESGLTEHLDLGRPRTLVLLSRSGVGHSVMGVLGALLTESSVPVVRTDVIPTWVGALDVVFVHTDDPADHELATSLERAARHGATVVLSGPSEGPVPSAIAGRGVLIPPRVEVPAELTFPRGLTTGLLTAHALGLVHTDTAALADKLDGEAGRCHPDQELVVSPAKTLALRMVERTPLLWGLDRLAVGVGQHAAYALASHAGTVCDVAGYRHAIARPGLYRQVLDNAAGYDIFADPDDDLPRTSLPLRVVLMAASSGAVTDHARFQMTEALPSADLLALEEEDETNDIDSAAVLALRCEFAAVYLGLVQTTLDQGV